jgi:hypothetical protein
MSCCAPKTFFVRRSFVESEETQRLLVEEALMCHARNEAVNVDENFATLRQWTASSKSSFKLNLGISCGGDLTNILPRAVTLARSAFQQVSLDVSATIATAKALQSIAEGPLSGLSLLYGTEAAMPPHYDSPTQQGHRKEWLVMMTFGNTILFRCNKEIISLKSGDALVMDSMAVLHGVEKIVVETDDPPICSRIHLPDSQLRLGILFWQGIQTPVHMPRLCSDALVDFEGMEGLFGSELDD